MKCARCDNEGTHHEWTVRGALRPITFPGGQHTSLCDTCWDLYTQLQAIDEAMTAAGVPRTEINLFLKKRIRQLANIPLDSRRVATG